MRSNDEWNTSGMRDISRKFTEGCWRPSQSRFSRSRISLVSKHHHQVNKHSITTTHSFIYKKPINFPKTETSLPKTYPNRTSCQNAAISQPPTHPPHPPPPSALLPQACAVTSSSSISAPHVQLVALPLLLHPLRRSASTAATTGT